jgi:chaperonin GroEL
MEDMSIAIGAKFFSSTIYQDISSVELKDLGTCHTVQSGSKSTFFQDCKPDVGKIMDRMNQLKARISGTTDPNEIERLQDRIARISSSIAAIYVGGLNDAERLERKHRIDDAIESVKAIESYGVVPGAGSFYAHVMQGMLPKIASDVKEELPKSYEKLIGEIHNIIGSALMSPSIKLMSFARIDVDPDMDHEQACIQAHKNFESGKFMGTNYQTDEEVDLIEAGIVEPTQLCINVICNALSVAGIMSTVKFVNVDEPSL